MRKRGRPPYPDVLTPREWEVLELLRAGRSNEEIADRLGISIKGAEYHVSEILGKLGVSDRHEAAAWMVPAAHRTLPATALAPLALLARRTAGVATRVPLWAGAAAAGVLMLALAGGIGVLAFVLLKGAGGPPLSERHQPCTAPDAGAALPSVVAIVSVSTSGCRLVPVADRIMHAEWVDDGKTFVAYDLDRRAFEIFDLRGQPLQEVDVNSPAAADSPVPGAVSVSPGGGTMLIERDVSHTLMLRDVSTGQERGVSTLDGVNADALFSPDGHHIAYINANNGLRSLVVAGPDGSGATAVRSVNDAQDYLTLLGWSPDAAYLLIMTGSVSGRCPGSADPTCPSGTERWEVVDAAGLSIWVSATQPLRGAGARLTNVSWAGGSRLLISQPQVPSLNGTTLTPVATFVDVQSGSRADAASLLADCDAVSPDGKFCGRENQLIDLTTAQPVTIIDYEATYQWSWTRDGSLALVSAKGT